MSEIEMEPADTLENTTAPGSSDILLACLTQAEKVFAPFSEACQKIDDLYSLKSDMAMFDVSDQKFQLFWASMEILKPSIYARPPVPVVAPRFKDRDPVVTVATEMLERTLATAFDVAGIDEVMLETRDDLAMANRGVQWLTYEDDEGQKVCIEHLDRTDFLHDPARKWCDVGWVARRAWMTREQMRKRFPDAPLDSAMFGTRQHDRNDDVSAKAGVWEVWSKADGRVYWVTPGVPVILDEGEPHLKLSGFFPCPRPAYGTRQRRSLIPTPDYMRYAPIIGQITELTTRIYALLREVRLKGFFPAGGDIGAALETALADKNSAQVLIPVPAATFAGAAGGQLVQFLPLTDIATAIQGLISARGQLIQDFYEISGISDIMRGATEASETLGAQQLKQHNGSIRVTEKVDELTRIAADTSRIAGEIIAEHFSQKTMLEMSQMKVRTRAEIDKAVMDAEKAADAELKALGKKAQEAVQQMAQSGQQDPEQAQQMQAQFQQEQQAIIGKYAPQLDALGKEVAIEDVMKLLRNDRTRGFVIEIQTDSTILTDDMAEKASRAEFLQAFNAAAQSIMVLAQAGPSGAELGGGMIKFALAPFRVGRELDGMIDKFVEDSQGLAGQASGQADGSAELAKAQEMLAQAEMTKAQAQVAKVQADTAAKGQQMQLQAQAEVQAAQQKMQEMAAKIEKERAELRLSVGELELKQREVTVKEREVAVKESLASVTMDSAMVDNNLKRATTVETVEANEALPEAVASSIAPLLAQMQATAAEQTAMIAQGLAALGAPKEIVRDENGKALGVRAVL